MRKRLLTMLTALLSAGLYAQVGINTEDPKASLDIVANTASPTANGLLVPRLTADEVQTMETQVGDDQNALLVYVTATFTASPTDARYTDIDAIGYYYYDAKDNAPHGKWKKLGSTPYTAGAGIEIGEGIVSATGLERTVVTSTFYNDYYAWSLIGRDKILRKGFRKPRYLPLGVGAVDLSYGDGNKSTNHFTGASGNFSVAMGYQTTASGNASIAMGYNTTALAANSTAIGLGTIAMGWDSTAMGAYNATSTNALLMVGNGNYSNRQNALTVYRNGDIEAQKIYTTDGSTATKVVVVDPDGKLQSIDKNSFAYNAGAGIEMASGTISATGLEKITEGGNTGWRLIGRDTNYYGNIGSNAVDLSYNYNNISTTRGATGESSTAMGLGTTASGKYSTVMGGYNTASGQYSVAMGNVSYASGNTSFAMGMGAHASGHASLAVGRETTAQGWFSVAMGGEWDGSASAGDRYRPAKALGTTSFAFGRWAEAQKNYSIAMGWGNSASELTKATGKYAISMGVGTTASGGASIAIGALTTASGDSSTAMGAASTALGEFSTAMGYDTTASGTGSTSMGYGTTASGESSTSMGDGTTASGNYSTAMGFVTTAKGESSTAMGYQTIAQGDYSTAMGGELDGGIIKSAKALGTNSFAFGSWAEAKADHSIAMGWGSSTTNLTKATGEYAIAMGYETIASGDRSTAMGNRVTASGTTSIAMGTTSTASGYGSTAIGYQTKALGRSSTAIGNQTSASGRYSTAMGSNTGARGVNSTAMGFGAFAKGDYSTAMGAETDAFGTTSTAMGVETQALGDYSTAMGFQTTASGESSTAMGKETKATGEGALACGKYNAPSTSYAFMVGNGTSDSNRKNAFYVWYDGDVSIQKNIYKVGDIRMSGRIRNTSDRRLKKDITTLPLASQTLSKLRPVQYHWNEVAQQRGNNDERLQYGFIAQEVEKVLPDLVSEDENKEGETGVLYKSINYIGIIPVLTKALQEKSAIIDEQQSEIEVLKVQLQAEKARNDQQEARLKAIEAKLK